MAIVDARRDVELLRGALDRTDALLGTTDAFLAQAEQVAQLAHRRAHQGSDRLTHLAHDGAEHAAELAHEAASGARRIAPVIMVTIGIAAVGAGLLIAWRMKRRRSQPVDYDASI